jgi:hypothetical protein
MFYPGAHLDAVPTMLIMDSPGRLALARRNNDRAGRKDFPEFLDLYVCLSRDKTHDR